MKPNSHWVCQRHHLQAACSAWRAAGSWRPASPQRLCCSSGWSPYPGSRTPPRSPCHPSSQWVSGAPRGGNSSLRCLLYPHLSHCLLLVPAVTKSLGYFNGYLISSKFWLNILSEADLQKYKHLKMRLHLSRVDINATLFITVSHQWIVLYLINEIESHSSLSDSHLFGLPVVPVVGTDLVYALVQVTGCLVLLPIFFSL